MQPFPQQLDIARQLDSSTATRQLDRPRQLLDAQAGIGDWSQPRQASTGSTGTRQELDRLDRQGLDSASTAPRRSLDSLTAPPQPGLIQVTTLRRLVPAPRGRCVACARRARPGSRLPGTGPSVEQCREPLDRRSRPPAPGSALGSSDTVDKAPTHNNRNINNTYDNVRPRSASHAAHLRDPAAFVVHKGFPQPAILLRMHATAASRFSLLHRLRGPSTGPWPQSIPCALSSIACISLSPGHKT